MNSRITEILGLLSDASRDDLSDLDGEIRRSEQALKGLRTLRKILAARTGQAKASAASNGATPRSGSPNGRNGNIVNERRRQAVSYIMSHGPQRQIDLQKALDIPGGGSISSVVDHPWFERINDKFGVTNEARTAILSGNSSHPTGGD